jgi:hypothetical protein
MFYFIFTRKDFKKKINSIYYTNQLCIHLWKIHFPITKTSIFNFQNMADMHKGYAYQISNYVAYKTFTKVQHSLPKQNWHEQNQKQ